MGSVDKAWIYRALDGYASCLRLHLTEPITASSGCLLIINQWVCHRKLRFGGKSDNRVRRLFTGLRKYARETSSQRTLKGVVRVRSRKTTDGNFFPNILKRGSVRKVSCHLHVSYQQVSRSRRADDTWRRRTHGRRGGPNGQPTKCAEIRGVNKEISKDKLDFGGR
ncbi:hypothetical protein TcasGA2_TC003769 [Tribolium castaneum]|uniref:Uncharacterized protein n=1 Tax=Tribolium castaneum TaxID=7070 RepID=D6WEL7_TRICA|nr:PREDICTED: uncharacterized protein LOC107397580 [Tribolium castaneum]EFA00866.1 hypothetical protein TcasGA2_TC003769 [Tribolium castaneum]|eukprot:XP_015833717.1 PREDICTED: uncharacterized protein LOC107397580 [Tribolium castaneum]